MEIRFVRHLLQSTGAHVRCRYGHVLDTKLIKVSKICPKGVQNLSKTCPNAKCVQMMSKMCPIDVQKVSNFVFLVQNASKPTKWFGHNFDIFPATEEVVQSSFRCPKYVQYMSKKCPICWTHYGHILDTHFL